MRDPLLRYVRLILSVYSKHNKSAIVAQKSNGYYQILFSICFLILSEAGIPFRLNILNNPPKIEVVRNE
jgi:hypothetical protein